MGGPTKDELLAELKEFGVQANPELTNPELKALLDSKRAQAAEREAATDIGQFVKYELSEEGARSYNRERDGMSRFLKASRGGPLPSVRAYEGQVVPVLVLAWDADGCASGTAFMPGAGFMWVENFVPYEEV